MKLTRHRRNYRQRNNDCSVYMANFLTRKICSKTNSRYANSPTHLSRHLLTSSQERKYFDSGDYALSKAGKASDAGVTTIGREHPVPENIPHSSSQNTPQVGNVNVQGHNGSPVKESSYLHRETSADDIENEQPKESVTSGKGLNTSGE